MASVARHRTPGQEADELSHGRKVDPLLPERLKDQNADISQLVVSVFGGFILSEANVIRSTGFGLEAGVLIDAFVTRSLLMPALMHLLGRSAWWLPHRLDRILPSIDIAGAALERDHPAMRTGAVPV